MNSLLYDEMGLMVVKEDHCCEHFEPDDSALVPMRECWNCKWSGFGGDGKNGTTEGYSVCSYAGNAKKAANC